MILRRQEVWKYTKLIKVLSKSNYYMVRRKHSSQMILKEQDWPHKKNLNKAHNNRQHLTIESILNQQFSVLMDLKFTIIDE